MQQPETKQAERCANTNPALTNPNTHERKVSMNMEQTTPLINLPVAAAGGVTMSSREIAELCEKQHQHVRRDIESMCAALQIDPSSFGRIYKDARNRDQAEYRLPKDLTLTLVSGYNVVLRKRIIDRWLELEGQGRPAAIDVRDPGQLALIASQLIEVTQEQAKQIEAMQDTVQAHERLCEAEGSFCITDAAKTLGIRRKDMFDWLHIHGWIFKRGEADEWVAYANRLAAGVMEHRVTTYTRPDGTEKVVTQARVTAKGLSVLAKVIFPTAKLIGGTAQ